VPSVYSVKVQTELLKGLLSLQGYLHNLNVANKKAAFAASIINLCLDHGNAFLHRCDYWQSISCSCPYPVG